MGSTGDGIFEIEALEGLDGLAYITNFDGDVLARGSRAWRSFAKQNGAPQLRDSIGTNILSACSDEETANAYRLKYHVLRSGRLGEYAFRYRCDCPDRRREFTMTLSRVALASGAGAVLHHSRLVSEAPREHLAIFERAQAVRFAAEGIYVKLCSYCQRVWDAFGRAWVEADFHPLSRQLGLRVGHGICPDCHDRVVAPVMRQLV